MKHFRGLYLIIYSTLAMALLCTACSTDDDDDDYVYPSVLTELVDIHVAADGYIDYITTDEGTTYVAENRINADKLNTDAVYRALCMYEKATSTKHTKGARLYSIKLTLSGKPTPKAQVKGEIKTDPLDVQSVWRGGSYLNMTLLPMVQSISHTYAIVEERLVEEGTGKKLYLLLHHNQNGDYEAYEQKTYMSIELGDYALQSGDSVFVSVNTYKEGMKTWGVAY